MHKRSFEPRTEAEQLLFSPVPTCPACRSELISAAVPATWSFHRDRWEVHSSASARGLSCTACGLTDFPILYQTLESVLIRLVPPGFVYLGLRDLDFVCLEPAVPVSVASFPLTQSGLPGHPLRGLWWKLHGALTTFDPGTVYAFDLVQGYDLSRFFAPADPPQAERTFV